MSEGTRRGIAWVIFIAVTASLAVLCIRGCGKANAYRELYGYEPQGWDDYTLAEQTVSPSDSALSLASAYDNVKYVSLDSEAIHVSIDGVPTEIALEEYIVGVVSAEMPASYELEALKAQAVAARTFAALHVLGEARCKTASAYSCDLCDDYTCCQAYLTDAELRTAWGDKYEANIAKVRKAVSSTRGVVALYNGKLISAVYHASSGESTEASEAVFAMALPYLVSVDSCEGSASMTTVTEFDYAELAELINSRFSEAHMPTDVSDAVISVWGRNDSGRVQLVQLGDTVVTGTQFRMTLKLKSANFNISIIDGNVVIECVGFGHGVGMSQYGANAMAKTGSGYIEILTHFYTGIELGLLKYEG